MGKVQSSGTTFEGGHVLSACISGVQGLVVGGDAEGCEASPALANRLCTYAGSQEKQL